MNKPNHEDQTHEIEQLLDLAEKVDKRIRELNQALFVYKKNLFTVVVSFFIVTFVLLATMPLVGLNDTIAFIVLIALASCFMGWFFLFISSQGRIKVDNEKQLQIEDKVLGDLVQMLSSLIEGIKPHVSIVTHATMEMRLRRIRFAPSRALSKSSTTKVKTSPAEGEIAVNEL